MAKNLSAINVDQPLTGMDSIEGDRLQRKGFAQAAMSALHRVSSTSGFVLSVEGPWGSGKTSTLSMIEQLLRNEPEQRSIIVHFNPWLIGDRDALLKQFLNSIARAIELTDHAKSAKKVAEEIKNYSAVFDLVKWIPGAEPMASLIKGVMNAAGHAAGGIADQKMADIEGQKRRLEVELGKFKKKIFVFIDDIDRLFPSEVFEMVRIIKSVGQLPNIGYIVAWDSEYVRSALKSASVPRSSTYLDKIVQIRLPLPAISSGARLQLLNEALSTLPAEAHENWFPNQQDRLEMLYFSGLRDLLDQPRDITRVVNTLSVIEPSLRGEIVFADIIGLSCLMVRAPQVYDELRKNPGSFARSPSEFDREEEQQAAAREKFDRMYRKTPNPAAVRELVHFLFPKVAESCGQHAFGATVDVEGHISAPSRLGIALGLAIGASDVSLVSARRYVVEPESRDAIEADLKAGGILGFLEAVGDLAKVLGPGETPDIEQLCIAVARIADNPNFSPTRARQDPFTIKMEVMAHRVIDALLKSRGRSEAIEILGAIVADPECLSVAAEILMHSRRDDQRDQYVVLEQSGLRKAGRLLVSNSLAAIKNGGFWSIANPSRVLWEIMQTTRKSAKDVFKEIRLDDPFLDKFALAFLKHSFSSNGGQSYSLPDHPDVNRFMSPERLRSHAKQRLEDPKVSYPIRAAWQSVVEGKPLFGKDGSDARH